MPIVSTVPMRARTFPSGSRMGYVAAFGPLPSYADAATLTAGEISGVSTAMASPATESFGQRVLIGIVTGVGVFVASELLERWFFSKKRRR